MVMTRMTARSAPTIGDIAKAAGVSRATVSRVFGRPDLISSETIDRVREVADKLGWTPNHAARALSTGKQGNIAVILPDIANPFFPPLIRAAQRTADGAGMGVFIGDTDNDQAQEFRLATVWARRSKASCWRPRACRRTISARSPRSARWF